MDDYASYYSGVEKILKAQGGKEYKGTLYLRTSWPTDDSNFEKNLKKMNENAEQVVKNIKSTYGINAYVIYDGNAFKKAREQGIVVYRTSYGDSAHQNVDGAYLAALCMYVKIYNENANTVTDPLYTTSTEIASKLKNIANLACK